MWLEIHDVAPSNVLEPELPDILRCYPGDPGYVWRLLDVHGEASEPVLNRLLPELESAVTNPGGVRLSWIDLNTITSTLRPYDLMIVGCDRDEVWPNELTDTAVQHVCCAAIELFDSSYWRIYETRRDVVSCLKRTFRDVRFPDRARRRGG